MSIMRCVKVLSLVALFAASCYNNPYGNRLYLPRPPGPVGPQGPAGKDGTNGTNGSNGESQSIPGGVALYLVNEADYYLSADGLTIYSPDTTKQPNSPGAFDEASTCTPNNRIGNKSFVGFYNTADGLLSGRKLSDVKSFSFEARKDDGATSMVYLNLLVDCNGNGSWEPSTDAIVTVSPDGLTFAFNQGVFSSVTVSATDSYFRSVGGRCGLPDHLGSTGSSLAALTSMNPNAKLIAAIPRDCGMPASSTMSPVLFIQGDSNANTTLRTTLRSFSIEIGTKTYTYRFATN